MKFAVIGDSGRGWAPQHEVARPMAAYREHFPFAFVLMAGDNIYEGPATPDDYRVKFEEPYATLLDAGVRFYAVLGNHDDTGAAPLRAVQHAGHRYYTFTPPATLARLVTDVRVFALDSTSLDDAQTRVAGRSCPNPPRAGKSDAAHPLYASGRYGGRRVSCAGSSSHCWSSMASTSSSPDTSTSTSAAGCSRASSTSSPAGPDRCAEATVATRGDRAELRRRLPFHARRDRRRRAVFPGDHAPWR